MFFVELQRVTEGRKIRRTKWTDGTYVYWDTVAKSFRRETGAFFEIVIGSRVDDWEYYEEGHRASGIRHQEGEGK